MPSTNAFLQSSRLLSVAQIAKQMEWRKEAAAALCVWVSPTTTQCKKKKKNTNISEVSLALGFHPHQQRAPQQLLLEHDTTTITSNNSLSSLHATLAQFPATVPLLIGWPVQSDGSGGTCGAACGRVLHVLDAAMASSTSMTKSQRRRPVALYTPPTTHNNSTTIPLLPDAFGRDPGYSRTSSKQCHVASHEQYQQYCGRHTITTATDLWRTVCADLFGDDASVVGVEEDEEDEWTSTETTTTTTTSYITAAAAPVSLVQQRA